MTDNQEPVSRVYLVAATGYCRSCRETEIFDRFKVTTKHTITGETELSTVAVCQGCEWEYEVFQ
ncbi:hypothetical protein [Paenibacillus sinopodophylli]|uniref:hypothetical protein n=1 Tax=Paenibacillus sinopodophylli TaxID=1837342 RepID=UPI00110CA2BE|nr:hypothetical protein [Paenibacillus sinopodophylli]